jgi:hypothetical protein
MLDRSASAKVHFPPVIAIAYLKVIIPFDAHGFNQTGFRSSSIITPVIALIRRFFLMCSGYVAHTR